MMFGLKKTWVALLGLVASQLAAVSLATDHHHLRSSSTNIESSGVAGRPGRHRNLQKVREYYLDATPVETAFGNGGVTQTLWAINGMIPGPTLEGNVGDTLRVHFMNNLDHATTIHWHGFEVTAMADGTLLSQIAVEPGTSYTYEFELVRAATYWYHPHVKSEVMVSFCPGGRS